MDALTADEDVKKENGGENTLKDGDDSGGDCFTDDEEQGDD